MSNRPRPAVADDWPTVQRMLLSWYRANGREGLPWRATRDPYAVLVSELMLQQTQVPRVIPKYEAFLKSFPTIDALARADRTAVLRAWQGLGYNSRAVRLHALANIVRSEHDGVLPRTYDGLRALPGIGPYTAGAVMGFAYDAPAPCVDVNIQRVLARIGWTRSQRAEPERVAALALRLVQESGRPHDWHSALMDFGSTVCTAKSPDCAACPLRGVCESKGPRNDETDASKRQPKFAGSVRWWRGQALKRLLVSSATSAALLRGIKPVPTADDEAMLARALAAMERDGLVSHGRGRYAMRKA